MATGFSFSNGTWSWSSGTVSLSIKPSAGTVTLKNINTGVTTSVNMNGVSSGSLQTPIGTLSLNSNGSGSVKVTGGSKFFSADLNYTMMGGAVSINSLTLGAKVESTGLLSLIGASTNCTATLTPINGPSGFDGFTGSASCLASIGSFFSWNSGTYTGTMNSGNFLNMVPGVSTIQDKQMRDIENINSQTFLGAKDLLDSYLDTAGYNGGGGKLSISAGGGYYQHADGVKDWLTSGVGGLPAMNPLMEDLAYAGIIGYVGDSGKQGPGGYSGTPAFTQDDKMHWNMAKILAPQQGPTSTMMSADGDSDFQKMIYFQAMTSALQATSAGYLFAGGPGS